MESLPFVIEKLRSYETLVELQKSCFFHNYREQIESFLRTPQIFACEGFNPRLHSFVRVLQWNIEKGKRFEEILDRLQTNEILKWADIIVLNEVDHGMNRSQNRHVALDLAKSLGMNMAFAPAHFELTKGTDEELALEGQNCESLQGNAVLSRYPIRKACVIPLPSFFEPYEFHEKRYGRRNCLWAQLRLQTDCLWVGSVHLELRTTPRFRAAQMNRVMEHLPGGHDEAYILGGDLNTNSFGRGTTWRTLQSIARFMSCPPSKMKEQLLRPERGNEPLFEILKHHGFAWQSLNSNEETSRAAINSLEETGFLPDFLIRIFKRRLEHYNGYLCFKLDWFLAKHIEVLSRGQKRDLKTDVYSLDPACLNGINAGPGRISDHLPIYADFDLASLVEANPGLPQK